MEDQCCTSCEHISNTSETSYIYLWNISLRLARTSSIIIDINHNRLHPMRNNKTIRKYSPGSCRLSDLDTWKSKWSIIYIEELESSKTSEETNYWNQNTWRTQNSGRHLLTQVMSNMTSHHLCHQDASRNHSVGPATKIHGFSNPSENPWRRWIYVLANFQAERKAILLTFCILLPP